MNRGILPVIIAVVAVVVLVGYLAIPRWACSSGGAPSAKEEEAEGPVREDARTPPSQPDRPPRSRMDAGRPTREAGASPSGGAADSGPVRPVGTGVLAGLVLDRNQAPAVGAVVTVRLDVGDEPWRPRRGGFEPPEPGLAAARVEMDGYFRIEGLPATALTVEATCAGLVREVQRAIDIPADGEAWVEFVLDAGLSISGRVTDDDGAPIAGAAVVAGMRGSDGIFGVTARDGSYELDGLREGSYRVQADAQGFVDAERDDVRAGSTGVDFRLGRAASISGRVVWRGAGSPVADADVRAVPSGPRFGPGGGWQGGRGGRGFGRGFSARTDRDGRFVLNDLLPGRWTVWADGPDRAPGSSQEVTLEPGTGVENLVIELGEGARIAGVVRADPDGRPVQGAVVRLGEAGASPMEDRAHRMMGPRLIARLGGGRPENAELTATTDASGRFELLHVAAGRQTLSATAAGHPEAEKTVVVPEDGELEGVELRLAAGGTIAGTVSDSRGGDRLASSIVFAGSEGSGGMGRGGMGGPAGTAEVDETGRYRIDGLGEGTYRVSVFQLPTDGGGPSVSAPQQAAVTIGETTTVDFQLGGGTDVHGRVLQAGAPVPGAHVELSAVEGPFGGRVSTVADEEGAYRFDGVVPGSYLARIDRSSQRVDVPDVEELELDLEIPSGAIAGRVLDAATGAPAVDARIVALRADGAGEGAEFHPGVRAGTGRSRPDGTFEVTGLAAGTYELTVSHESYASATVSAEVPAGGRREGVEVRLTGGVVVSGRVIDSQGAAVADAMVSVFDAQTGSPVRASMAGRITGPDGAFEIRGLSPGRYGLGARARGYGSSAPLQIDASAGAQGVELVLAEGGP